MSNRKNDRHIRRRRRHFRIRRKIRGEPQRPRLSVFRSARHIYVQAVDDAAGRTLAAASTCDKALRGQVSGHSGNAGAAAVVGRVLAHRLTEQGVSRIVFDRGGYRYTGRVKALADAARESGLEF